MSKKPPAFPFYAKDWLSSDATTLMTPAQRGLYIDLLARMWDSDRIGYLADDPEILWRLARCASREEFDKDSAIVLAQFRKTKDRKSLFHPRLVAERKKQLEFHRRQALAGRNGAKAKKIKKLQASNPSATLQPERSEARACSLHLPLHLQEEAAAALWEDVGIERMTVSMGYRDQAEKMYPLRGDQTLGVFMGCVIDAADALGIPKDGEWCRRKAEVCKRERQARPIPITSKSKAPVDQAAVDEEYARNGINMHARSK